YGKTSFLNILKDRLIQNNNVIIEFNPWLSPNSNSLTTDFFTTLENQLKKHIETNNIILDYGEALSKINHNHNPLSYFSHLFNKDVNLNNHFLKINNVISKINKPLFVLIDDVDRLDNHEVFNLLRMVRNSGNFSRINFIVT